MKKDSQLHRLDIVFFVCTFHQDGVGCVLFLWKIILILRREDNEKQVETLSTSKEMMKVDTGNDVKMSKRVLIHRGITKI